uniref:SgrR family transcriptional regulator n=1 Tax=Thaumasiovibrio occultus TaxID=1891184 RepID=UPI000B35F404|nr:SgrR family transcriptional regulator [Thaumasiovibrio occultus]
MSGSRLKQQFLKLYHQYQGQDADVTVSDLVDVFSCTRRNVRMVMSKLSEEGWIQWSPAVGRGKLSRLQFVVSEDDLAKADVDDLLRNGQFDKALSVLGNDRQRLVEALRDHLGYARNEGRQILRLPYYRAINPLHPRRPMRRSEQHLARQIYNGLVRYCETQQAVVADLAHHWKMISPRHWRFFLRPAVRFHNGQLVSAEDYLVTLRQLQTFPLFSHIERVEWPQENIVDIHLSADDRQLVEQLVAIEAVIQPAAIVTQVEAFVPIGTGPYRIEQADQQQLKLQAFDHYFGYRALVDEIEIWVLPDLEDCGALLPQVNAPESEASRPDQVATRLDEGCSYLLINQNSPVGQDEQWREYFTSRFDPVVLHYLMQDLRKDNMHMIPAYGFLPGWKQNVPRRRKVALPATKHPLVLGYVQSHPAFFEIAYLMADLLKQDGIECQMVGIDYEAFHSDAHIQADLWLSGVNLVSRQTNMLVNWLFQHHHIVRALTKEAQVDAFEQIDRWRSGLSDECPAQNTIASLIGKGQLLPLFHSWAGIRPTPDLRDVQTNSMGWFDFTQVWVDPDIS